MKKLALAAVSTLLIFSCKQDPEIPEVDPVFQEKKRPPYNEAVMSKIQSREHDKDYQEVNPNFANEYQDAQREFDRKNQSVQNDITKVQSTQSEIKQYSQEPLTVQKIRDDSAAFNAQQQSQFQPVQTQQQTPQISKPQTIEIPQSQVAPAPAGEVFEVQAGSFKSIDGAQKVVQKLQNAGIANVRIEKANDMNSVRIAGAKPFTTRSEASKFLQEIIEKTQHYDIMVVRK